MLQRKINNRIMEMFNKGEFDDDFINLELDEFIKSRLFPYQHLHVFNLISCLKKNNVVIDGSNTGTGKTYTSIAVAKHFNLIPIIICPKGSINIWKEVCEYFKIKPLLITNYELLRKGNNGDTEKKILYLSNKEFTWKFDNPKKIIVIFDEAHKCKNYNTLNGKLLLSLKNICKIMLLSATLCDHPKNFKIFGYMLDFYDNLKKGKKWIENIIIEQDKNKCKNNYQNIIHKYIFPEKGSKMCILDIGENYPMNQINVNCYDVDDKNIKRINMAYNNILSEMKNNNAESLTKILVERQEIELIKVPLIINLIDKYLEHNKSIAIFVNFRKTLTNISQYLDNIGIKYSQIHGSQTIIEREKNINDFQNNSVKIILSTIQSGGQSINLHDIQGNNPRISIISPSFSSTELLQTLGRIYRVGLKSPTLQIILFYAGTVEKKISDIIKKKINFMDKITDDDLIFDIFK